MEPIVIRIKIDPTKIAKGHTPHRSGAGKHKNWRKQTRYQTKIQMRKEQNGE